jgi:hypothetical protein
VFLGVWPCSLVTERANICYISTALCDITFLKTDLKSKFFPINYKYIFHYSKYQLDAPLF